MKLFEDKANLNLTVGIGSDTGVKRSGRPNEDLTGSFVNDSTALRSTDERGYLFVLADGMGGAAGGSEASRIAVESTIDTYYHCDFNAGVIGALRDSIVTANAEIWQGGEREHLKGMGTTIVAAVIRGKRLGIGHVGDSRAYLLRDGVLAQLTADHTLVQALVDAEILSPAEAASDERRSLLTKNLGHAETIDPDLQEIALQHGDVVVLCSDGLWEAVPAPEITRLLAKYDGNAATRRLIAEANRRGGPDNVSVITIHVSAERN